MSSVAIKITSSIADAARAAAKLADRSLTAQIEHWARLGMDADEKLTGSAMMAMKQGDWETSAKPQDLAEIRSYLAQLSLPGKATELALASGFLDGKTTYSREDGAVVRTNPDGTETRWKLSLAESEQIQQLLAKPPAVNAAAKKAAKDMATHVHIRS